MLGEFKSAIKCTNIRIASDWLFPILLVLLSVSGLTIHFLRYQNLPMATYYAYVAHLAIMMMLYVTVGPMGKWAHLIYRPFAVYFQAVKASAKQVQEESSAVPCGSRLKFIKLLCFNKRRLIMSEKMAVVCNGNTPANIMPTLIFSSSGLSLDYEVHVFFCPAGANWLLKGELEKLGTPKGLPNPVELVQHHLGFGRRNRPLRARSGK